MKNRIVLWGTDENEKKVLIALELQVKENRVDVYSFQEELATEVFYNQMMNQWRNNEDILFPEGTKKEERELSVTGDMLPEALKVERTDIINRAKTEWHFAVLSSKMYEMYRSEVEGIKEKVEQLSDYDKDLWNEMKTFWSKVQSQVREKNLYREHANSLRKSSDSVFDTLKKLRKALDNEFEKVSTEAVNGFFSKMETIEAKIDKGLGLKPIFEELKKVQNEFRDAKFTRDDRNKVWKRLDAAFKTVKEKRFGDAGETQSATSRLQRRYDGLMSAVDKMQKSINRDKSDKNFQDKRIDVTEGQLEAQLRQAKVMMIDERIASKEVKLADMMQTKIDLEKKLEQEKKREVKREEKAKVEKVKNELKAKVEEEIKGKQAEMSALDKSKLEKAAADIKDTKKPKVEVKEQKPADEKSTEVKVAAAAVATAVVAKEVKAAVSKEVKAEVVKAETVKLEEKKTQEVEVEENQKEAKVERKEVASKSTEKSIEKSTDKPADNATVNDNVNEVIADAGATVVIKDNEKEIPALGIEKSVKEPGLVEAISVMATEAIEDVVDTVKAIKEVVEDKIEDVIESISEEE